MSKDLIWILFFLIFALNVILDSRCKLFWKLKKELYFWRTETFRRNTCKKENSEFNTGRCILQNWHHSTIDQNYSLSLLSASDQHVAHEEFRPYLMPYWDGSLCEPHKDMRYACRPLKTVGSSLSRDALSFFNYKKETRNSQRLHRQLTKQWY